MNRNLEQNFNRALPLGQPVAPSPIPLPANLPNPIINLAPLPPPPTPPALGMGQPLLVPQFFGQAPVAPPPPDPPQPQPVPAGQPPLPDNMRVTRPLRHQNNIQLLPPLSAIYKQLPFTVNPAVASGPSLVSDHFGLPIVKSGFQTPAWIKNRRCFLKKLSPAARNLPLTGDPFFAFDNSPMSQPGSLSHLQPPQTTTSHIPSLWTHL